MGGGTVSYRQKGRGRADVGWECGGEETGKWDIMGWGGGVDGGGNKEVEYHLRFKQME